MSFAVCFHCGEKVQTGEQFKTFIDGKHQPMCCLGCQAVSQAIIDAGLHNYYKHRSELGIKQSQFIPDELNSFHAYDLPEIQTDFVHAEGNTVSTSLSIDGITCAACAWLIEHKINQIDGIALIQVNSTTQRALVKWDPEKLKLSFILDQISRIGYQAAPYQVDEQEINSKKNSRKFLLRLGLAGFATMQVMMFALALYAGYFSNIETEYRNYFRVVSMMFAAPVVFYSAQPFYFSALRSLFMGRINMDVSVSIAILSAFIASCIATFKGNGDVYFESVSMFTFFLLLGRYFEQNTIQKASVSASNLHKLVPLTALLKQGEDIEEIPAKRLKVGDIIQVRSGEFIAADGIVMQGVSQVNEAMLTGEQMPQTKQIGDTVYAGTINQDQNLEIEVTAVGQAQFVAEIIRLQEQASNNKPAVAETANKLSSYFSAIILTIAAITYLVWHQIAPENAFWVTLSVLVATCPCALALATPTAITCATALFTRLGVLVRNSNVFEKLPHINAVVFDKTGTLTLGNLTVIDTHITPNRQYTKNEVLAIAAALEAGSLHPIASAFAPFKTSLSSTKCKNHIGLGISGNVQQEHYRIGSAEFVIDSLQQQQNQQVYLADNKGLIATFTLQDNLREDAKNTIEQLKQQNIKTLIASGDAACHVKQLAAQVNISDFYADLKPADKLKLIQELQKQNNVAMFGDGINDAPVLAGANLSIAMGSGTDIAKNSADLILLGDHLSRFLQAAKIAKKTNQIIWQNFIWALGYNLLILPLAIAGYIVPYIAAIGMSASSLIVISNSLRLLRIKL